MQEQINMNNLAIKFLNSIKDWIDKIITERTKECMRSKIAIIIKDNKDNSYNVILSGDYGKYLLLQEQLESKEIDETKFNKEVSMLTLDNLIAVKTDTYSEGDYVLIGYVDNKLTNAFILYKSIKRGV